MRIDKSGIRDGEKYQAQRMLNQIRAGTRVFGNPGEGLQITLREMDKSISDRKKDPLDFNLDNSDLMADIAKIKAGIEGERALAGYLEKLIRLDESLDGLVVFASLSAEDGKSEDKDYISDTDFVAVYGEHILILDAKNIRTHPENPVFLEGTSLRNMNAVLLEDVQPSTFFWKGYFKRMGIKIGSIDGYMVIYNKAGATILKNSDWYKSGTKPIHISELKKTLNEWIDGKDGTASLKIITEISNSQIKKERSDMDLSAAFKRFRL